MANLDRDFYLDKHGLQSFVDEFETNIIAEGYSRSATYAIGDYCVYENLFYRCTTAILSGESWDPSHWTQVLIGDELVGLNQEATTTTSGLMSATDKVKLDGIESGAEVNVQSDWNAVSGDALILNKPTLGEASSKGVSTTVTSGDPNLVTSGAVYDSLNSKMDKANPTGTGALSLNRASGTTVAFNSVAEGTRCEASGNQSHAEGYQTVANTSAAHAEGRETKASGAYSHAEGYKTVAGGERSHAEGTYTTASESHSHAEGNSTEASGNASHAENYGAKASGAYSHAEGLFTEANHRSQHVFGEYNVADPSTAASTNKGNYAEIVGNGSNDANRSNARTLDWSGNEVLAGDLTINGSTSVGSTLNTKMDKANPTGTGALSIGRKAETTVGSQSVAAGYNAEASGAISVALGHATTATGDNGSFAEGYGTTASGEYGSHAEGRATTASGNNGSHAEGYRTSSNGMSGSHAEGYETQTTSDSTSAHAEGYQTQSGGLASHSEGIGTIASRRSHHVFGDYNIADTQGANANAKGAYIEIVGNGTNTDNRSNARTLDWNGNETLAGDLIINGNTSVSTTLTNLNPKKVDIANSTLLDYRRCVIALCRVSTTDDTFLNSYSAGTISFHRDNGLNGVAVIDFDIENNYRSAYSANVCSAYSNLQYADIPTVSKNKTWSWCSFKHNDIYYAGIEYYIADAMSHNIIVDYVGNFEPFAFAWYDTKNSAILDTEFSNSVSYTTPRHRRDEYFSERLYANKPINTFITGTGTAAEDEGSGVSPRFFPAIWTFDVKRTALNGDTVTIKVPVAGHDYGVYLSIDNGTNYYPIVTSGTSRLTTHYPVGSFVNLVFDDTGSASSMFPLNGGDSRVTVTGGVWRVLNYYDSGNTKVTQSATNTNANYEILFSATADNTSRTEGAGKYSNLLFNPSTGNLQTTQLNGVTIGNSPKFTDTTYSAGNGMTLSGTTFKAGTRWEATTQGQTWSRLYLATPVVLTEGSSGLLNITCTRGSVVCNATFLITTSHAGATFSTCQELASCNYTQVRSRLVVASNGTYYFEVYDTAQSIASGVTQKWHCCFIPLADTTLTCYTSFEDGSTIPSGYAEANDFTTTGGNTASAIKNITRSGTTFTATRQDGTTFTFTQQDNDTKNTAGSTDTTSKLFLIGATSQAANPQTYSDDRCYVTDGTLSANIISSYAGVYANTANSGTAGGLALYSTDPTRYGSTMRQTGSASGQLGKHGYVQGDWAIYYCMAQGTGAESRGWIFRGPTSGGNIASIDTGGNAVFNGSVTIGGNTTNTSGARMVYNSSTKAIDFVFV